MPKPLGPDGKKNLIGQRLRNLRARDGLSQRDLAQKLQLSGLDMDKNAITRIEKNKRYVTDIELHVIARIFDVSYYYLIDGEEATQSSERFR